MGSVVWFDADVIVDCDAQPLLTPEYRKCAAAHSIYLDADLAMKEKALSRATPTEAKSVRYRPDDKLLAFLKGL